MASNPQKKMHELLAVRDNLKGQSSKVTNDLAVTFTRKQHLFQQKQKTVKYLKESEPDTVEMESNIQTTVAKEMSWVRKHLVSFIDVSHQIDTANMGAKADIVNAEGDVLLKAVPVATLLNLEKHQIPALKALIEAIPTLDPAKGFVLDENMGNGVYRARDVVKDREKKSREVVTLAPATDKHPAQTQLVDTQVKVGTIFEQEWSSMLTPHDKAALLENVEELYRMVAAARAKANEHTVDITDLKIGSRLLDYVFGSVLTT